LAFKQGRVTEWAFYGYVLPWHHNFLIPPYSSAVVESELMQNVEIDNSTNYQNILPNKAKVGSGRLNSRNDFK